MRSSSVSGDTAFQTSLFFFKDRQQRNIDDIQDCVRTFIEVITKMIHFKTILLLLVLFLI